MMAYATRRPIFVQLESSNEYRSLQGQKFTTQKTTIRMQKRIKRHTSPNFFQPFLNFIHSFFLRHDSESASPEGKQAQAMGCEEIEAWKMTFSFKNNRSLFSKDSLIFQGCVPFFFRPIFFQKECVYHVLTINEMS